MGLQIRQKLASPGAVFAFNAFCRTGSWQAAEILVWLETR